MVEKLRSWDWYWFYLRSDEERRLSGKMGCGGVEEEDVCNIVEYKATVDYLHMYDITDYEVRKIKSGSCILRQGIRRARDQASSFTFTN